MALGGAKTEVETFTPGMVIRKLLGLGSTNALLLVVAYAAFLGWMHYLVRDEFNVAYFKQYVTARCTAKATDGLRHPEPPEQLRATAAALRQCQNLDVKVDGVWGGLWGRPSVRLLVAPRDGAQPELRYLSVSVNPIIGVASISYEISRTTYYLNL